jgi:hypothetical protein
LSAQRTERLHLTQLKACSTRPHAKSLKIHLMRERQEANFKRHALFGATAADDAALEVACTERDLSDTLAMPCKSDELASVVERRMANPRNAPRRAPKRKPNTAIEMRLGRTLAAVHPMPLKLRMNPFTTRVVFDDRPGGHDTTLVVYICEPCENRIRVATMSLASILRQANAPPDEIWTRQGRIWIGDPKNRPQRLPYRGTQQAAAAAKAAARGTKRAMDQSAILSTAEVQQLLSVRQEGV